MVHVLAVVERLLWRVLRGFASLLLIVLLALLFLQIAGRYLKIQALAPHDEVITLFTVWFVFISSALLVREREHIRVEFLEQVLHQKRGLRRFADLMVELLVLVFVVFYLRSAVTVAAFSTMKVSQVLRWSEVVWYSSIVASAGLMILYSVRRVVFLVAGDPGAE